MLVTRLPAPILKWKSANTLIDGMHYFLGASVSKAIRLPVPWGYKPTNSHKTVRSSARMQRATQLQHLHIRREQDMEKQEKEGERKKARICDTEII